MGTAQEPIVVAFPLRGEWLAPNTPGTKIPSHGTNQLGTRYAFDFVQVDWNRTGSYGRGPKGEIWKIEESIFPFLRLTAQILSKDACFFLINSYTTGLQPAVLSYMLQTVITPQFDGYVEAGEIGLPVSSNSLILPCGASGRWTGSLQ